MTDNDTANQTLPEGLKARIRWSQSVDAVPGGVGPFGKDLRNPIPVNGPLGEAFYLSSLETDEGVPVAYQRMGSVEEIDVFETVSFDGHLWQMLYFDMYYPRRSKLAPAGYRIGQLDSIRGVTNFEQEFPRGLGQRVANETQRRFGLAFVHPGLRVLEAIGTTRPWPLAFAPEKGRS